MIQSFVARSGHFLALAGCGLILLCASVAVVNAIMRGVIGSSIYGVNDLLSLLIFVGITACLPKAMSVGSHMRVTMFGQMLRRRGRWVVEAFANVMTLAFVAVLGLKAVDQSRDLAAYHEVTDIAGIPLAPFWWFASAMILIAALVQLFVVLGLHQTGVQDAPAEELV